MPSTRNCMKGRVGVFDNLIADGGWGGAHRSSPALDPHPHSRLMGMRRGGGGGKRW